MMTYSRAASSSSSAARLLLLSLLAAAASTANADEEIGLCCLCEGCGLATSGRGSLIVTSNGVTCNTMSLDLADIAAPGSDECINLQGKYRPSCCDPNYDPPPVQAAPTQSPRSNLPPGSDPPCNICMDGSYPQKPNTVTAVLYLSGNPTCGQLYWMGLNGNIPERVCNPLVDYMEGPCGCDGRSDGSGSQAATGSSDPHSNDNATGGAADNGDTTTTSGADDAGEQTEKRQTPAKGMSAMSSGAAAPTAKVMSAAVLGATAVLFLLLGAAL